MNNILFTGGGTAGHITPNIALIENLKEYNISYIGMKNSMEEALIKETGVAFYSISAGKLRRYFDVKNFIDIFKILLGLIQSILMMNKIKPNIVFSKGGFVSCPVVWAAFLKRIPIIIHESDITPGLANRLCIPFATKVCYSFIETQNYLPKNKRIYSGLPIRNFIFNGNNVQGLNLCDFNNQKPVILVVGGSLGSAFINQIIRDNLDELLKIFQICHICGKNNIDNTLINIKGYRQFEYVGEDLTHFLKMSELIISRAGATFIFEILALCKLNILIPLSKKVSRGDQILNAESFKKLGYSKVLYEEDSFDIKSEIIEVFENKDKYINNMNKCQNENSTEKICEIIKNLMT